MSGTVFDIVIYKVIPLDNVHLLQLRVVGLNTHWATLCLIIIYLQLINGFWS